MLEESKQVADNMAEADRNHVLRFVEEQQTLTSHLNSIYVKGKASIEITTHHSPSVDVI